jgi:hypothetical protein
VGIILHTDGKDAERGPPSQRNRALQMERFGTVALPYYVLMDPTGKEIYWEGGGVFNAEEVLDILAKVP